MLFPRLQLSKHTFLPWRQGKTQHSQGFPHFSSSTRYCVSFMGLPQYLVSQLLTFRHRAGILWKDCAREGDCTMEIAGLQSLTLLDYPGKVACTVFFAGCNLRCPYCHNAALVLPGLSPPPRTEESLLDFLQSRRGMLDGVCLTGREPTLQKDLAALIGKIHAIDFLVKLDTNGKRPETLKTLLDETILKYLAMEIKNATDRYAETCEADVLN